MIVMPHSTSFWEHPIEKLEEALHIRRQIAALQKKLGSMFGDRSPSLASISTRAGAKKGGKRTMSPEAREKIAAAQRRRWAKTRGTSAGSSQTASKSRAPKKKGGITPEGRAKLAAAMKARWAARRKGAPALNAKK